MKRDPFLELSIVGFDFQIRRFPYQLAATGPRGNKYIQIPIPDVPRMSTADTVLGVFRHVLVWPARLLEGLPIDG